LRGGGLSFPSFSFANVFPFFPVSPLPTTSKEVHPLGLSMSSTMFCHVSTEGGGSGGCTHVGGGRGGLTPLGKPWSGNDATTTRTPADGDEDLVVFLPNNDLNGV
jgi:hypothetical protein